MGAAAASLFLGGLIVSLRFREPPASPVASALTGACELLLALTLVFKFDKAGSVACLTCGAC